jgi:hypothetical protein
MVNEIEAFRESMRQSLVSARPCPEEGFTEPSPCGRYLLQVEIYATAEAPEIPALAVATVRSVPTGEAVVTVNRNDDRCFHAWVTRDERDYLLFAEDLEGHSVIDLTTRRVVGFSSPDERFIWAKIYPSPDRTRLAVVGCYWACPYEVAVYDFSEPMRLPLPVIARFDLPGNDATFGWVTDGVIRLVDREGVARLIELPGP